MGTYGIHALSQCALADTYPYKTGTYREMFTTMGGCDVNIPLSAGMWGIRHNGSCGSTSSVVVRTQDSYYSFKKQLDKFVHWLRTGEEPHPFSETQELIKMVIGGIRSQEEEGRKFMLDEIKL